MTPTGSNLLGIVKHLASVQAGYFGDVFGLPWPEPMPWMGSDAQINDDMYATSHESTESIRGMYERSLAHAKATFEARDLDDVGAVAWWPADRRNPTLRTVMVHMLVETARHAGHLDILRELIDGNAGRFENDGSMPSGDVFDWEAYVGRVQQAADDASR